jgi:hypothetical protein
MMLGESRIVQLHIWTCFLDRDFREKLSFRGATTPKTVSCHAAPQSLFPRSFGSGSSHVPVQCHDVDKNRSA